MFHGWIGVAIGIAFVLLGFITSVMYLPKKFKDPDVTISHIRHLHLESLVLVLGGLFIIVLSLLLLSFS